jgi:hypothetical protein
MSKRILWWGVFYLAVLFADRSALAASMVLFDFDQIQSHSKNPQSHSKTGVNASDVEAYMEGLFGSNITVSQKTSAVNSSLRVGKGKGRRESPSILAPIRSTHSASIFSSLKRQKASQSWPMVSSSISRLYQRLKEKRV